MKAIRVNEFGGPEVLKLEEVNEPKPALGQILVKIKAAGVNPVETYIRSGGYARKPNLPYTPGGDGAGLVEAVGEGVSQLKPGNRVYLSGSLTGTYAEKALCMENQVHHLPDAVGFSQGAALGVPYATACYGLFYLAKGKPGETVLIHGASGGVGIAAIQLAKTIGMIVVGTAGSEKGRKLVAEQGANLVLDHSAQGYLDELKTFTGGRGVDVVIEMLANVNLPADLEALAPKGRVVVIGSRGPVVINPREIMSRNAQVMGMVLFNASEPELRSVHAMLGAGLANKTLRPVIGKEFPLKSAPEAHESVMRPGAYGKIVLVP